MVRRGFGLAEVVVALVVFTIGALGAAALTAHAARIAGNAYRREVALLQVSTLLDSLLAAAATEAGATADRYAAYAWTVRVDSTGRRVDVRAMLHASGDTIRLAGHRPPLPAMLRTTP